MPVTKQRKKRAQVPLTDRQREVFEWVEEFRIVSGRSPTVREVQNGMHVSTRAAYEILGRLAVRGLVLSNRSMHAAREVRSPIIEFGRRVGLLLISHLRGEPRDHGLSSEAAAKVIEAYCSAINEKGESGSRNPALPSS